MAPKPQRRPDRPARAPTVGVAGRMARWLGPMLGSMRSASTLPTPLSWITAFVLTAVGYVVAGIVALPLSTPPAFASPLFPAAGIAFASVLMFGRRMVPAIVLGALVVGAAYNVQRHTAGIESMPLLVLTTMAFGAALQAWLGTALLRRLVAAPITLSTPRDIALFMFAAVASCCVNPVLSTAALNWSGSVSLGRTPFTAATWWIGDLLGVLTTAPIVMTLLAAPREEWAPRRLSVGLTFALVTVLLVVGIRQVGSWNQERVHSSFDRDASDAVLAVTERLARPLLALEAMHSVYLASPVVSTAAFRAASQAWLDMGTVEAIAWNERVAQADVPTFEAQVRADGMVDFSVARRSNAPGGPTPGADGLVLRQIEPTDMHRNLLGIDLLSAPAAREAVLRAIRSGRPSATALFTLGGSGGSGGNGGNSGNSSSNSAEPAVIVYQAVYAPSAQASGAAPTIDPRGVVSVTIDPQELLATSVPETPAYLALCLFDVSSGADPVRLAGNANCDAAPRSLQFTHGFGYAGRRWELQVAASTVDVSLARSLDIWLFAVVGLLSTSLLGGYLLALTGRTRRIEKAVRERTASLREEVREREVAEAALRESEQRFRNILATVPIGVIYTDLRGDVRQANPRFCQLTGYTEQELLAMSLADYTHPDEMSHDISHMTQLVRGEIPFYRRHTRYIGKHGGTIWVLNTVSLLRDAGGQPRSIVGVVEDVTEHRKLEEAELGREAAEASNRAKSEFLSRMSHELRTPLNAMLGFAQLLELDPRHPLDEVQRHWVGQIQQAGWHLLEMINDVLDLSRIESGNLRLQVQTVHLPNLLESTIALIEGEASLRRIDIRRDLGTGPRTMLGDPTRVKQILTNLLSNAVKYNAEGGTIDISARTVEDDAVEIVVTDTGLGMTPSQMAQLFQPFNRLGRELSERSGTGIGLVISQRLAELMGGTLRARSVAGEGSAFILTLPRSIDPDTVRANLEAGAAESVDYHRRLVHYVEDNETNVEVMRGILAQRPQVELQVSLTGLDGLAAIRAHRPDLILLDMHLPDISGMELLRHLQQDPQTGGIPIVVVSANALAEQIDAAMEAGCVHYLTKPVNISELLATIDRLLERADTRFG